MPDYIEALTQTEHQVVYTVPQIIYGSQRWRRVVREHIRLGRSPAEALAFVNHLLTDPATLPDFIPRFRWRFESVPLK